MKFDIAGMALFIMIALSLPTCGGCNSSCDDPSVLYRVGR